jgi:hypothetical protein
MSNYLSSWYSPKVWEIKSNIRSAEAAHRPCKSCCTLKLNRGPPSWLKFSTFVYRGSSHRHKIAACVLNLIWFGQIACQSQLGGEEGVNFLIQMISTCLPSRRGRGDGGRHSHSRGQCTLRIMCCLIGAAIVLPFSN